MAAVADLSATRRKVSLRASVPGTAEAGMYPQRNRVPSSVTRP